MVRTTLRQPWVLALAAALVIATLGTASASPRKGAVDEDAMSRAVAFETALTTVAESVSPSVVSIQVEVSRPQNDGFPFFFGGQGRGGIVRGGGSEPCQDTALRSRFARSWGPSGRGTGRRR